MKTVFKVILSLIILSFIILYISYRNGYYVRRNEENTILTEEMIKEYENDLKNGVDVSKKNYIVVHETYDNGYSRAILKVSEKIEKIFDKTIKFIFQRISNTINE